MVDEELTQKIIGCAYKVHNVLGHGFMEKVYENAMLIELQKQGLEVRQQTPVNVYYEGIVIGDYIVDLLVENKVIIELKAVQNMCREHEVQLVNYLTATKIDIGLLINFGLGSVQIKRKLRKSIAKQKIQ